jgi:hypothetical protein
MEPHFVVVGQGQEKEIPGQNEKDRKITGFNET